MKPGNSSIHFGTDGWRGVIGRDFTFQNVQKVTHAVGKTFKPGPGRPFPKVYIGYDHRFLAEQFAEEVASVLSLYRFNPSLLPHPVTSPLLSFQTWKAKSPFGIMVTASHNPAEYLGLKVKGSFGGSISQETVRKIERNLTNRFKAKDRPLMRDHSSLWHKEAPGSVRSPLPSYMDYLRTHINWRLIKRSRFAVCFDPMYGPAGRIIDHFFKSADSKIKIKTIHSQRDPLFGSLQPEPIEKQLSDLKMAIKKFKSGVGFAFDGDGDRLGVIDEKGQYLTPHQVFSLLLFYLVKEKGLRGKVVQSVSLGFLSKRIAEDFSLRFEEVPVGFKYVAEKMLEEKVLIGGEESGGYAFGTTLPERDGFLTALLFLEMVLATGKRVSRLLEDLKKHYGKSFYLRRDIPLPHPITEKSLFVRRVQQQFSTQWFGKRIREIKTMDGLKVVMDDDSWLLIRPSGTEPVVRIYGEFPDENLTKNSLAKLSKILYDVLKK